MKADGIGGRRCSAPRHGAATPGTQYQEDIARAQGAVGDGAPELQAASVLRPSAADRDVQRCIAQATGRLPESLRDEARLVFTAHSIPMRAVDRCGPGLYLRQVRLHSGLIAAAAGHQDFRRGVAVALRPPQVRGWNRCGRTSFSTCRSRHPGRRRLPVGFVADHIEVIWDLDCELAEQAEKWVSRWPGPQRRMPSRVSPGSRWTSSTRRAPGCARQDCWRRTDFDRWRISSLLLRRALRRQRQRKILHPPNEASAAARSRQPTRTLVPGGVQDRGHGRQAAERTTAASGRIAGVGDPGLEALWVPIGAIPERR